MVEGDMKQYVKESFKGDMIYVSATPNASLGGLSTIRTTIPLDLTPVIDAEVSKGILEVAIRAPHEKFMWRLKVNGIPVAREFKPQVLARLKNGVFAKLVYDITPILKTPESLRKNRINVTIKYEGSDRIYVEHIGALIGYESDDAETRISMLSGALALEPGEETLLKIDHPGELNVPAVLKTVLILPSTQARILLKFNNNEDYMLGGVVGGEEVSFNVKCNNGLNTILVKHMESETQYYPKELLLSSIILMQTKYVEPLLEIIELKTPEKIFPGEKLRIRIKNKGQAKPGRALLTIIYRGQAIHQQKLPLLEPDEETEVEIPIKLPKGEHDINLRLVWRKLSKTMFKDNPIKIKVW